MRSPDGDQEGCTASPWTSFRGEPPSTLDKPPPHLDKPPRLLSFVEAEAVPALAARGRADVILSIDVDEGGRVTSVAVTQPAGEGFDEAAVAAARQFVFAPDEAGQLDRQIVRIGIQRVYRRERLPLLCR
jgi:TonB family protein